MFWRDRPNARFRRLLLGRLHCLDSFRLRLFTVACPTRLPAGGGRYRPICVPIDVTINMSIINVNRCSYTGMYKKARIGNGLRKVQGHSIVFADMTAGVQP